LSESPPEVKPSPLLGEHTDQILKTILGLSEGEIEAAHQQGAV
jgi:formyl-CoA transferase